MEVGGAETRNVDLDLVVFSQIIRRDPVVGVADVRGSGTRQSPSGYSP